MPTIDELLPLLYPDLTRSDVMERALLSAGHRAINDLSTVRRIMGDLDRQLYPSPVLVRFGRADLVEVEVGGLNMVVDRSDRSVARWMLERREYQPHVRRVFEHYCEPGMTVVDAGANIGYFSLLASRAVGARGRVIAIEPNSENSRLILINAMA
ncbi:MAG: hypothetical protein J2P28_06320, partial [Actinobacteria bacterium]|nr:hypothetical protein [Actinomycetota bacterium]